MSYEGMRVWANSQGRMKRDGEVAPWRPWEPCRENVAESNTCNLHDDCAYVDRVIRETRGESGYHCHDPSCAGCLGP